MRRWTVQGVGDGVGSSGAVCGRCGPAAALGQGRWDVCGEREEGGDWSDFLTEKVTDVGDQARDSG